MKPTQKYLNVLDYMYNQKENINMQNIYKRFKICRNLGTSLKKLNLIKQDSKNSYKWVGKRPTVKMAETIIEMKRTRNEQLKEPKYTEIELAINLLKQNGYKIYREY